MATQVIREHKFTDDELLKTRTTILTGDDPVTKRQEIREVGQLLCHCHVALCMLFVSDRCSVLDFDSHVLLALTLTVAHVACVQYFHRTFTLFERMHEVFKNDETHFLQPEKLRHPLIFYLCAYLAYVHVLCSFLLLFLLQVTR